ncbi:hypothetical protein IWX78_002523 [Mycetocola sp. CAN_C7]|uniref:DUF6541 family protein n=1 Tax=Mycetocola sp. CAN_C7 TaxID=2787724 RepID=UPI0018CB246A
MNWLLALPVLVVAVGVLYLPGLALLVAAGARGFLLYVAAPAVSVAAVAVLAIVFPYLNLTWTVPLVLLVLAGLVAVVAVIRRIVAGSWAVRRVEQNAVTALWTVAGLATAAVVITAQLIIVIGEPANMSQTFDAAFHLNGVKFILDTANASSFHLSGLILPEGASSFYPAAWHGIVSLVSASSGGGILVAANMVNIVIAAAVWPAGVMMLTRVFVPGSRVAIVAAGIVSAGIPGFPLLPLDYGVLYPYFLALAFIPLALALALSFTRLVSFPFDAPILLRALALMATLAAMGLAQSAAVFAWAAMLVPVLLAVVIDVWRRHPSSRLRWPVLLAGGAALAVLAVAWYVIGRLGNTAPWDAYATPLYALVELFSNSREGAAPALVISILTVIGLVAVLRGGRWWIAGMWTVAAALFILGASLPYGDLRNVAIGLFYKDTPRLTALLGTIAAPLAALGVVAVWTWAAGRLAPELFARLRSGRTPLVVPVIAGVLLLATTQGGMQAAVVEARPKYAMTEWSPILSIDERSLLERLHENVPEDAVVAGNPWTGASLAYAVGDRRVLNPHFNVSAEPDHVLINMRLNEAASDPAVCDAVTTLGVGYVLDFGVYTRDAGGTLSFDSTTNYKGFLDLAESGVVEEIDREGDKVLYRITACE